MPRRSPRSIFDTIYKGSVVRYDVAAVRAIAPSVLLVHVKSTLNAPAGSLAGEHTALATLVLVDDRGNWRIAAFHNTLIKYGNRAVAKEDQHARPCCVVVVDNVRSLPDRVGSAGACTVSGWTP